MEGRPTLHDILRARKVIRQYLRPTPLISYPALNALAGCELWLKHENHQPIGAFKVRGGIYLMSRLRDDERARGVIAASTGNHGQSVAYAARTFGVPAIVGVPEEANPSKVESMRNLGAEVIFHGRDFEECRQYVEALAATRSYRYVHSGDEPYLIAGVGTIALEMLEEQPELDTLLVPVGGGSGAAGACIAAKTIDPAIRVVGVQAAGAPSIYHSWKEHRPVTTESADTFAEGLATRAPFDLPLEILWDSLDDFVLVSDAELQEAVRVLIEKTHNLAEGAGAAPLAGALKLREQLRGHRVGIVLSGGNLSLPQLRTILEDSGPRTQDSGLG